MNKYKVYSHYNDQMQCFYVGIARQLIDAYRFDNRSEIWEEYVKNYCVNNGGKPTVQFNTLFINLEQARHIEEETLRKWMDHYACNFILQPKPLIEKSWEIKREYCSKVSDVSYIPTLVNTAVTTGVPLIRSNFNLVNAVTFSIKENTALSPANKYFL